MSELTFEIEVDVFAENPRKAFDTLGTILYTSSRYTLGDRQATSEEIDAIMADDKYLSFPVYAYIHGGTALSTSPFGCRFDSGMCGVMYAEKTELEKEFGELTPETLERLEKGFKAELREFQAYLNGEVYGWIVRDEAGEPVESCWGYYDYDFAVDDAKEAIERLSSKAA